jgi:hypothetical protein
MMIKSLYNYINLVEQTNAIKDYQENGGDNQSDWTTRDNRIVEIVGHGSIINGDINTNIPMSHSALKEDINE